MARLKYKRTYIRELGSAIYQKNLNKYLRVGKIENVNVTTGTCRIVWLDVPGFKENVLLTQGMEKEWHIPEIGSIVIVGFDTKDQARILRYINVGTKNRIEQLSLPFLKPGEKLWEVGGSFIYMKKNGDIVFSTLTEGYVALENVTGTFKVETINQKTTTEAGKQYFGIVKRVKSNADGTKSQQMITDITGNNFYTEYRLQVLETADNQLGVSGLNDPILDLTLGTVVDEDGNVINKNNEIAIGDNYKQLVARLKLKSGVQLDIDKEGRVSIKNIKLNINQGSVDNNDKDISKGLESNNNSLGTKGQHVAREHDEVTIPFAGLIGYTNTEHKGLEDKAQNNKSVLANIARAFISPAGPCTFDPTLLSSSVELKGEITEGASNVIIGDK